MKPIKKFRLLAPIILALFILSLFTGIVVAQAPATERIEKANKEYQINKDKFENTKKQFEDAKKLFEDANRRLRNVKDDRSGNKSEELMERAREYILRAIDHTESQLQVMKNKLDNPENKGIRAQDATKIIDAHTAQLEQLRVKVNQATTIQEIRDAHKELAGIVANINLETHYFLGMVLNVRIDNFITKADNVSARLDAAIRDMKAKGKDTTKLEKRAADFIKALDEAKELHNETKELFAEHNGFDSNGTVTNSKDAKAFLNEANKLQRETIHKLKNAGKQVIDFVKDFKKIVGRNVKVGEKGDLEVNGGSSSTQTATPEPTATANATATPETTATANATATPETTATANATATPETTETAGV
jgi:hypothetical protein